jgi:hypothetical protein
MSPTLKNVRFTTPIQQLYNNPSHEGLLYSCCIGVVQESNPVPPYAHVVQGSLLLYDLSQSHKLILYLFVYSFKKKEL